MVTEVRGCLSCYVSEWAWMMAGEMDDGLCYQTEPCMQDYGQLCRKDTGLLGSSSFGNKIGKHKVYFKLNQIII